VRTTCTEMATMHKTPHENNMDEAPKPINLKTQNNHVVTNYY